MTPCFSTLGCPELSLDEVLGLARRFDLPAVELRALGGTIELPAYFTATYGTPAALADLLRAEPVRIGSLDTSLKLVESSDADWEATTEAFLPWAEVLGSVNLRVFDGGKSGSAEEHAAMAARLRWWQARRASRGWRSDLIIETHDSLFNAEKILGLVALEPSVRILWDSHHTWRPGGEDPLVTWRAIAPHVVHVHVKDSLPVPTGRHSHTYVFPGRGEFPAAALLPVLAAEFAGVVSLEWERLWHPYLAPLDEALAAGREQRWW